MSILGSIINAVLGPGKAASQAPSTTPTSVDPPGSASAPAPAARAPSTTAAPAPLAPAATSSSAVAGSTVDVEVVLAKLASQKKEKLDWRHSIVDLMKVLDLDSSLAARKQLATELHYDGDTGDSVKMNVWLHRQVVRKLAENGGMVPDNLKH
jgi:hypothetical protein